MEWKTETYKLKHPVSLDGETLTKITLREPDVDALERIDDLGIEPGKNLSIRQLRGIIEALGDAPSALVGKMHRSDLAGLGELVVPLLDAPEATTEPDKAS